MRIVSSTNPFISKHISELHRFIFIIILKWNNASGAFCEKQTMLITGKYKGLSNSQMTNPLTGPKIETQKRKVTVPYSLCVQFSPHHRNWNMSTSMNPEAGVMGIVFTREARPFTAPIVFAFGMPSTLSLLYIHETVKSFSIYLKHSSQCLTPSCCLNVWEPVACCSNLL